MLVLQPYHWDIFSLLQIGMWFLAIFKSMKWCQSIQKPRKYQNQVYTLSNYFLGWWIRCKPQKKRFESGKLVFRTLFDNCFGYFDAKNTDFWCFLMFFDDFGGYKLLGSFRWSRLVYKNPKKSKLLKIGLNIP